jgi:DNA-binding Xre family transcriptional regulator
MKRPMSEGQRMLARNVWRLREVQRMNADKLAAKLDWALVELEKLERAEKPDITLQDIDHLATALEVHPRELFQVSSH